MCGPRTEETGSASVLIEHKLVLLAGSASPAAAHLSFTDHLETHARTKPAHKHAHTKHAHTHAHTRMHAVKGLKAPVELFCS